MIKWSHRDNKPLWWSRNSNSYSCHILIRTELYCTVLDPYVIKKYVRIIRKNNLWVVDSCYNDNSTASSLPIYDTIPYLWFCLSPFVCQFVTPSLSVSVFFRMSICESVTQYVQWVPTSFSSKVCLAWSDLISSNLLIRKPVSRPQYLSTSTSSHYPVPSQHPYLFSNILLKIPHSAQNIEHISKSNKKQRTIVLTHLFFDCPWTNEEQPWQHLQYLRYRLHWLRLLSLLLIPLPWCANENWKRES